MTVQPQGPGLNVVPEPAESVAQITYENAELKELLGGPDRWAITTGYLGRARAIWEDREARRWLDAQGWREPAVAADLAAELAGPRETFPHRIAALAGWNHNVLVAGPRKVGKSQLMINLCAALSLSKMTVDPATGQPFCAPSTFLGGPLGGGTQVYLGGNVGYLNGEMDRDDWLDCFRALPGGSYDASRIKAIHCRGIPLPVITSGAARAWFIRWLRDNWVEVLIIDTWGDFCAKNGVRNFNDDGEVRVITSGLDQIKRETWVSSIAVPIHMPHQDGTPAKERFKGAGAVGDWADTLWSYVQPKKDDPARYLSATGRARIDVPEIALGYDRETGLLWWEGGNRVTRERDSMRGQIIEAVRSDPGIKAEDLKDAAGGHRNDAATAIKNLIAEGVLRVEKEGNIRHHFLAEASDQDGAPG